MRIKFLGVRGSRPTHSSELLRYGGNTTSMEFVFEKENFQIFLDGGTGLAHYGREKGAVPKDKRKIYFLITHTHWDHILGFPYFKPLFNPKNHFTFYASQTSKATFSELFLGLHSSRHLQVPPFLAKAKMSFVTVKPDITFYIENCVKVKTHQINHQGITLAYRLEYQESSVAIITDNAPIDHGNYLGEGMKEAAKDRERFFESEYNTSLVRFLRNVHTAVFDTHFTEQNLKVDWGHSTPQRALDFCKRAQVKRLIIFHHAPEDSDALVDKKVREIVEEGRHFGIEVIAAREGEEWKLCN